MKIMRDIIGTIGIVLFIFYMANASVVNRDALEVYNLAISALKKELRE